MAIFAKYDGVDGESNDQHHTQWIDVRALEWAVATPETAAGARRRAPAEVEAMVLTMEYDKAAPQLLERALTGQTISRLEVELTAEHGGSREVYLRYELENVRVSSYQVTAYDETRPTVLVANSFDEIEVTYTEFAASGAQRDRVEVRHNVRKGQAARAAKSATAKSAKAASRKDRDAGRKTKEKKKKK